MTIRSWPTWVLILLLIAVFSSAIFSRVESKGWRTSQHHREEQARARAAAAERARIYQEWYFSLSPQDRKVEDFRNGLRWQAAKLHGAAMELRWKREECLQRVVWNYGQCN